MVDFAGWSMPVQYTSIVEEHKATRTAVGMFDISHMGRLTITGSGAADFLDRMVTRRINNMKPGQIRYALVCNEAGGILDDVLVYRMVDTPEDYVMVVNASNREKIVAWLEKHLDDNTQLEDQTLAKAMIAIQGPQAVELVDKPLWLRPACDALLHRQEYQDRRQRMLSQPHRLHRRRRLRNYLRCRASSFRLGANPHSG